MSIGREKQIGEKMKLGDWLEPSSAPITKCKDCFFYQSVHPVQTSAGSVEGMCTREVDGGVVYEEWGACIDFKKFIGWAYR